MRVIIWAERNPGLQGGAESWIDDTAKALRRREHAVAWLWSSQIEQAVEQFKPDAVILSTLHNFVGLQHVERLLDLGVPGVWFLHDYWPWCSPRMLMQDQNRSDQPCEAAQDICANSCGGQHVVPAIVRRFPLVTGCEGAAAIMRRHGLTVGVLEEGIDTDMFRPGEKDSPHVVYASAAWHAPWKGMHVLAEAVKGLPVELRILSGLTREALAAELSKASIFVMPSLYQEIWGLALTEAMACGCAVIGTTVAGLDAQIDTPRPGRLGTGHLAAPGVANHIKAWIEYFLERPDIRQAMGTNARAHVEQDHSLDALGTRWEETLTAIRKGELCAV